MKQKIKYLTKKFFKLFNVQADFNRPNHWAEKILDDNFGHNKSNLEKKSIDKNQQPLPWYTYPAIEFINQLDLSDKYVFEWGSGNSSIYYSNVAKEVISVESDKYWYDIVKRYPRSNGKVIFRNEHDYPNVICDLGRKFDIIIIDGLKRVICAQIGPDFLADGGMIILDNSDWFIEAGDILRDTDLIQIDFSGFGPINKYSWTTSFFLTRNFNIPRIKDIQSPNPIGGIPGPGE